MSNKTYINSIKVKEIGQYANLSVSFNLDKLIEELTPLKNEKGYVNLIVSKRKEPGKFGETHSVALNDFKPKDSDPNDRFPSNAGYKLPEDNKQVDENDDLPF